MAIHPRYNFLGHGVADPRYSWPTRKFTIGKSERGPTPAVFSYFVRHFPSFLWGRNSGQISELINLLVHRIMTILNEQREFEETEVRKIIIAFRREIEADAVTKANLVKTALFHIAFGVGVPQMVKLFYKMKFQTFQDHEGYFAIHKAVREGHAECCKLLLQRDRRNAKRLSGRGETALTLACNASMPLDMVKLLLENGVDPNFRDRCAYVSGWQVPLFIAIWHRNEDLITLLLESGADPKMTATGGQTTLHAAAQCDNMKNFVRFLELGVSLYALDSDGWSCLMTAVIYNNLPITRYILQTADRCDRALELVNGTNQSGNSTLTIASGQGNLEIMEELIKYGADCSYIDPEGKSPLSVACSCLRSARLRSADTSDSRKYLECIRYLLPRISLQSIAERPELLMWTIANYNAVDMLQYVLDAKVPLDACFRLKVPQHYNWKQKRIPNATFYNFTILWEAVKNGSTDVVDTLVAAGAKMVHQGSRLESSPFTHALRSPLNIKIIECFLNHNVDLNFVREGSSHRVPEALTLLLKCHNDPLCVDALLLLLKCGLDPSVNYWCSCKPDIGNARRRKRAKRHVLLESLKNTQITKYREIVTTLLGFSAVITPCLEEVLASVECRPQVPLLRHLCRLAYRKTLTPSQLLNEQWMETSDLPDQVKLYISFQAPL